MHMYSYSHIFSIVWLTYYYYYYYYYHLCIGKLVEDAMLSKIDDLERSLKKERSTSSSLRSDCNRMREEVHHVKEENVKLREMNKKNDTLIEHLRSRQIELEEMQSTAQETVMDSEARLGSAMEQIAQLQSLQSSGSEEANILSEAAVETARKEANDIRSKLRVAVGKYNFCFVMIYCKISINSSHNIFSSFLF
jgi:chromosome segregation ATPase